MKTTYLLIATVAVLCGCTTSSMSPAKPEGLAAFKDDPRLGEEVERICFRSNIDGFSNNRAKTVVLTKSVREKYLVEVRGICPTLRYADAIAIDSTLSCVTDGDYLIVSDSAFSRNDDTRIGQERCSIKSMHKWLPDAKTKE